MNQWANTVLTEKGAAILAKLTQGNTLNITRAIISSGFVTPGLLVKQTEVTTPQQERNISSVTYPEEGKCKLTVDLTNVGLADGYTATQVGIYATDPDEGEVLFIITQAQDEQSGTIIPSETEMPGYSSEWSFYFKYGQADGVTITVDPANTVSRAEMEIYVEEEFSSRPSVYSQPDEPQDAADNSVWVDQDDDNTDGEPTADDIGVILDAHIANETNPHGVTIEQIGAAPDGYGLGSSQEFTADKLDSLTKPGFFYTDNEMTIAGFTSSRWWMEVSAYGEGASFATQEMHTFYDGKGYVVERHKVNEKWGEWGWKNPPFLFGVEYRTTEKWNGKDVYARNVDIGKTSANYGFYVDLGGITGLVRSVPNLGSILCDNWDSNNVRELGSGINAENAFYFLAQKNSSTEVYVCGACGNLRINQSLRAQFWYTKD